METPMTKQELRRAMREVRASMGIVERETAQRAVTERLLSLPAIKHAQVIGIYKAYGAEVSLNNFAMAMWQYSDRRKIGMPICTSAKAITFLHVDNTVDYAMFDNPTAIVADYDLNRVITTQEFDVMLVPGIAFDAQCNRLGQGGGYYDRYLPLLSPECLTIGVAFDEQIVDAVPIDNFDVQLDYVVTPTQIFAH